MPTAPLHTRNSAKAAEAHKRSTQRIVWPPFCYRPTQLHDSCVENILVRDMEVNHKQQNRDKWRSSTRRGKGRGRGGQGGQAGASALESNHNRFQESDDEEPSEPTALDVPAKQSQGADLEQLLAEAEQFYAQAHHRYRSFIEAVDLEPPAVDVAALEQELVIDPDLLIRSLLPLPLPELFSIAVPQVFLSDGSWDDPPKVVRPQEASCDTGEGPTSSLSAASTDTHQPQQQQQQQARDSRETLLAQARGQQEQTSKQRCGADRALLPPQFTAGQLCTNFTSPSAAAAAAATCAQQRPSAVQPAALNERSQRVQLAATSRQDDDTDELLDLLLSGQDASQPSSRASTTAARAEVPATQTVHSRAGDTMRPAQTSSVSEPVGSKHSHRSQPSGPGMQQMQAPPPAAVAVAAATTHKQPGASKPASAVIDDELQALLGLDGSSGPAACASRGQVQSTTATAKSKGSLEDWLDKF